MKMATNRLWRYESDSDPLVNMVPQVAKDIASEKKMNRNIRIATPTYTECVAMMKDSPAKKIIFGSKSVAK